MSKESTNCLKGLSFQVLNPIINLQRNNIKFWVISWNSWRGTCQRSNSTILFNLYRRQIKHMAQCWEGRTSMILNHSFPDIWEERRLIRCLTAVQNAQSFSDNLQVDLCMKYWLTLCKTTSNGPWSDKGLLISMATNSIPLFLHQTYCYLTVHHDSFGWAFLIIETVSFKDS